ncbi:LLM class flavin-dependent oxidoreductase [Enterovirga sp. DB1703]|uniref:LLM class flavin-dependent oxidoreductase n=2 Tax=Enterovirga aerilata TaxID=2730920 RepID=A0A849IBE7_9HYPH|nr:LLM class flavin-dependent oxidoreductase [Enterovirga sp. DB1703]
MNCVGHIQHGLWTHPRDRSSEYTTIGYWQHLARTAERGLFDGIFLADIVGVYDVQEGSRDPSLRHAVQTPINDPFLVVPVMAAVTEHLGFGVTANATYEPPYLLARRFSTLDHLTGGRAGWNIVTGYLDSAAKAMGLSEQVKHDDRYESAEEYLEVIYNLLEGSWDDDAVVRDRAGRVYTRPEKVRAVRHEGKRFRLDAIHLSEPSPQRTPVLFQAGASSRGRDFAARHAECVFLAGPTNDHTRRTVADTRARAAAQGRGRDDLLFFLSRTAVVGRTRAEAEEKFAEYRRYASYEGALAHFAASTGIDFSGYDPDEPLRYEKNDAINSMLESVTIDSDETWTLRKIFGPRGLGSRNPPLVGSAEEVADELIRIVEETDIDGFNLSRVVTPEGLEDFVDLVVPILQERGAYKREYAPGTFREKLFGPGRARLPQSHPAARFRPRPAAIAAE